MGAMALFGEKYGDKVRVVSVGDWAHELCGGTHVSNSGELGLVKLISESSIGAGVRRVEALVGNDAYSFLAREHLLLNSITDLIKGAKVEELPERISDLLDKVKTVEKELQEFKTADALAKAKELLSKKESFGKFDGIIAEFGKNVSGDDLRTIAIDLRSKISDGVVVLASKGEERVSLVAAVGNAGKAAGIKAGDLVKSASAILGGGGGGKDDFAQGGGTNQDKLPEVFSTIKSLLGNVK
jgi:alanyl-tRNA synthetase